MTIAIGITGGIGAGKSTICRVFRLLGVPVFEADKAARQLLNTNQQIKQGLINLFGEAVYTENGQPDRKKLAGIIFNNDIQLQKINNLVHPVVREAFNVWADKQKAPYVIQEAAILFESGFYKMMDYSILVTAPLSERMKRVCARDKASEKQVKERMQKQWTDDEKRKLATLEIKNDNTELIIPKVINIDKQLKEYGKIW